MLEKRSETKATKQRYCEHSFHFALAIMNIGSFLEYLTIRMCTFRQASVIDVFEPGSSRGASNYSTHETRMKCAHMVSDC